MCTLHCRSHPAAISTLYPQGHWLQPREAGTNSNAISCWVLRVPIALWEKLSLPSCCRSSTVFWCLSSHTWYSGLCSLLSPKGKYRGLTFGAFRSLAEACPSDGIDDQIAQGVQSKLAMHPEGHSHTSFGHRWPCLHRHGYFSLALPTSPCSCLSAKARFGSHVGQLHFLRDV